MYWTIYFHQILRLLPCMIHVTLLCQNLWSFAIDRSTLRVFWAKRKCSQGACKLSLLNDQSLFTFIFTDYSNVCWRHLWIRVMARMLLKDDRVKSCLYSSSISCIQHLFKLTTEFTKMVIWLNKRFGRFILFSLLFFFEGEQCLFSNIFLW